MSASCNNVFRPADEQSYMNNMGEIEDGGVYAAETPTSCEVDRRGSLLLLASDGLPSPCRWLRCPAGSCRTGTITCLPGLCLCFLLRCCRRRHGTAPFAEEAENGRLQGFGEGRQGHGGEGRALVCTRPLRCVVTSTAANHMILRRASQTIDIRPN